MIHVLEEAPVLVPVIPEREYGRDSTGAGAAEGFAQDRVRPVGQEHVGPELLQHLIEQVEELLGFEPIGMRAVVVPRQQHRDRHASEREVDGRPSDHPVGGLLHGSHERGCRRPARQLDAEAGQMLVDVRWPGVEAGGGQHPALVARFGQPLHQDSDAVRGAALRIGVGVVNGQKDPHERGRYHRRAARVKLRQRVDVSESCVQVLREYFLVPTALRASSSQN